MNEWRTFVVNKSQPKVCLNVGDKTRCVANRLLFFVTTVMGCKLWGKKKSYNFGLYQSTPDKFFNWNLKYREFKEKELNFSED